MCYKNGKDILPPKLLKELQKYIQGETIYIPKEDNVRKAWGESNGTRKLIRERNMKIYELYRSGHTITMLSESYNLSEDSIRKIVFNIKNKNTNYKVKLNSDGAFTPSEC